jgi:hypothetical protein
VLIGAHHKVGEGLKMPGPGVGHFQHDPPPQNFNFFSDGLIRYAYKYHSISLHCPLFFFSARCHAVEHCGPCGPETRYGPGDKGRLGAMLLPWRG